MQISGQPGKPPAKCFRSNDEGELPTCTSDGSGGWEVSYPSSGFAGGGEGLFAVFFVLALAAGVAGTLWKVSTARRMARQAGMDERDATTMALLTDEGFEATYLASSLRRSEAGAPGASSDQSRPTTTAERLRELDSLRAQGLVSEEEYVAARRAILDSL